MLGDAVRKRFHCCEVHVTAEETVLGCKLLVTAPGERERERMDFNFKRFKQKFLMFMAALLAVSNKMDL